MNLRKLMRGVFKHKLRIGEAGCLGILILLTGTSATVMVYERITSTGTYRQEYSGRVLQKTTRFHESQEGSSKERYLIIEEQDGSRSPVSVGEATYNRAEIGMWIRKTKSGVELSPKESQRTPGSNPQER